MVSRQQWAANMAPVWHISAAFCWYRLRECLVRETVQCRQCMRRLLGGPAAPASLHCRGCNFVGVCDRLAGWCRCPAGWTGDDCSTRLKASCSTARCPSRRCSLAGHAGRLCRWVAVVRRVCAGSAPPPPPTQHPSPSPHPPHTLTDFPPCVCSAPAPGITAGTVSSRSTSRLTTASPAAALHVARSSATRMSVGCQGLSGLLAC